MDFPLAADVGSVSREIGGHESNPTSVYLPTVSVNIGTGTGNATLALGEWRRWRTALLQEGPEAQATNFERILAGEGFPRDSFKVRVLKKVADSDAGKRDADAEPVPAASDDQLKLSRLYLQRYVDKAVQGDVVEDWTPLTLTTCTN